MGLECDVSRTAAREWYQVQEDISKGVDMSRERPIVRDFYDWASSILAAEMASENRWGLLASWQREHVALNAARAAVAALENSLFDQLPEGRK